MRNFLWSGDPTVKKLITVKWDEVNAPTSEGGLGLRRLQTMNKALLLKILWKIENEEVEWTKFMKAKYKTKSGEWISYYKQSSIWPGIKWVMPEFKEGTRWIVGNGRNISVWHDKWITENALIESHAANPYVLQHPNLKVEHLIVNGSWQIPMEIANMINLYELPVLGATQDKLIWEADLKANLWKILRGACATEETVRKRGFSTVSKCYLCGNGHDRMEHILWHCDFSIQIWHWVTGIFNCSQPIKFEDIILFSRGKSSAIKAIWFNCTFNILVQLWMTRNGMIYEAEKPSVSKLIQKVIHFTQECASRYKGTKKGDLYDMRVTSFFGISGIPTHFSDVKQCFFHLPSLNQLLICCDGASKGNPGNAGIGFIARNHQGECVGAASGGIGIASNYIAEVMAVIVAGEWAVRKKHSSVCFSLDSLSALQSFCSNTVPWIVRTRWDNIKKHIQHIIFEHSYREVNFSADTMAKKGVLLARGIIVYYDEKPGFLNELEQVEGLYFRFTS